MSKLTDLLAAAAEHARVIFLEGYHFMEDRCESEIEKIMLLALYRATLNHGGEYESLDMRKRDVDCLAFEPFSPMDDVYHALIFSQAKFGDYRADFAIYDHSLRDQAPRWIIVECDGHDYHERTKEQARRDKRRDRYMTGCGAVVLRFTGSEIWADAEGCVEEILNHLRMNQQ